jgi:hypothetical protein
VRLAYSSRSGTDLVFEFEDLTQGEPWPAERWKLALAPGDTIETVALSHVSRFIPAALSLLDPKIPTLGPARGERRVLAIEGEGRLELIDDTKVLFLKGSPEEMGRQHGLLMKKEVRNLVDRILYGVGVGSSFEKGRWFMGEIEQAHPRLPHPLKDTALMSAGDRYEKLAERVKEGYGKFDADSARRLMERPVAMKSNIHSVLFAPDTIEFWVANADSQNVASHTRYTHYDLKELLQGSPRP